MAPTATYSTPAPAPVQVLSEVVDARKTPSKKSRSSVRAVLMRSGTSKGLFIQLDDLPADRRNWAPVILGAMGSPDPFLKQLDGLGGGQSTQSKVAIVSRSAVPGADIDYLFVQVPVNSGTLDFTGNCGNMCAGVGPFAIEEGLFDMPCNKSGEVTVRIHNVNTGVLIHSTFEVENGLPVDFGTMQLDGVTALGSPIRLDFLSPSGSMTGALLPTGQPMDIISLPDPVNSSAAESVYHVSCVDSANPFVFVDAEDFGMTGNETGVALVAITSQLMRIRAVMSVRMGLARTIAEAEKVMGTPKIALVGAPSIASALSSNGSASSTPDILVRPFSMGKPHPTIQMTGAICVATACSIPGTVAANKFRLGSSHKERADTSMVIIGHGSGVMCTASRIKVEENGSIDVISGSVYRTARRLMEGRVYYQS